MNIQSYIDPVGRHHFRCYGYFENKKFALKDEELFECYNWALKNLPSINWNISEYGYHSFYISNKDEENLFLERYNVKIYNNCFFILQNGEYVLSIISRSCLKEKFDNLEDFRKSYNKIRGDLSEKWLDQAKTEALKFLEESTAPSLENPEIWYYNNIGGLAGSAGYCCVNYEKRIVYSLLGIWRS